MRKFETELKMAVKNCELGRRTRRALRVARLFNRQLIKDVGRWSAEIVAGDSRRARYQVGERQFSFDETPLVHVKMYRPNSMSARFLFPCMNPWPDCDGGFNDGKRGGYYQGDDEIDLRAQKFIDEFYEQIKLQRSNNI